MPCTFHHTRISLLEDFTYRRRAYDFESGGTSVAQQRTLRGDCRERQPIPGKLEKVLCEQRM